MNALLETPIPNASETLGMLVDKLLNWCLDSGLKIIIALVLLFISFKIINLIARKIQKKLKNNDKFDKTLVKTLTNIGKIGLKIAIIVCLIGYLGIDTSGLTALVTSLGVCVGLAVNGALSNLAGGFLILFTRPFKVDDYIEVESTGIAGTVEDIQIVCTKICTPDNKMIYVPNGTLSNSNIINYSEKDTRRVDFTFSIAYDNDFEKAKAIILAVCESHSLVLDDPAPLVRMTEHGQSSINITARVWVKSGDYWTVKFDILESVKKAFDKSGISIPYNQLDVHVKKD